MYILTIERKWNKQKYRFKMEVPFTSRKQAIEEFNRYADKHDGESILVSCRLVREEPDDTNKD